MSVRAGARASIERYEGAETLWKLTLKGVKGGAECRCEVE